MKTNIRVFKDSTGRILWYIKADNGKITDISEQFLRSDPVPVVAFDISPSVTDKENKETSKNNGSQNSGHDKNNAFLLFLTDLGGAAVILAIPLYIGGWTYLQAYYKRFGLRMTELGFSLYDVLVYSIPILFYKWWMTIAILVLLFVIGIASSIKKIENILTPIKMVLFIILYIFLITGAAKLGAQMGGEDAIRDIKAATTTLPYVAIEVDPEKVKYNVERYVEYNRLEYSLLLNKNGQYYVFTPIKQLGGEDIDIATKQLEISVIPSNLVNLVRIQRGVVLGR